MKYIFKDDKKVGEMPIKEFQLCFYDMKKDGTCYDENFFPPNEFNVSDLVFVDTEENKNDTDRTRLFMHHINGDIYELKLNKLSQDEINNSNYFTKDT